MRAVLPSTLSVTIVRRRARPELLFLVQARSRAMHGCMSTFEVRVWNTGETQARRLGYPICRVSLDAGVDAAAAQCVS